MECIKNNKAIKRAVQEIIAKKPLVQACLNAIRAQGGRAFLVGGAVRDIVLGVPAKDIDIEVYGLSLSRLEDVLRQFGPVRTVGKVYGVLRLDNLDVDWSLPRSDTSGRKPDVVVNPSMNFEQAAKRRDLTINAMGIDMHNYTLHDPFGGFDDIKKGVLRTPDTIFFVQDPLRLFRVMQFIGRFEMRPDDALNKICKTMNIDAVSQERIAEEFQKLLLHSKQPSRGIRWLRSIGRLQEVMPEIYAMLHTPQRPDYHPEGNVFEHAMQSLDAAAQMSYKTKDEALIQLLAALLHDCGKVSTTELINGVLKSIGHAQVGSPIAQKVVAQLTGNKKYARAVGTLVYYHMDPLSFIKNNAGLAAYKKLAHALYPSATIAMLANLWHADRMGRNPQKGALPIIHKDKDIDLFISRARQAGVLYTPEEAILRGSDFNGIVKPGPLVGKLLKKAYTIQIEKGITDKQELKKRAMQGLVSVSKSK